MKESNKLIAQFMGGIYRTDLPFTYTKSGWENTPANDNKQIAQDYDLKYHCDWSWLMPVIEKIINDNIAYPRTFGMISDTGQMMFRFDQCCLFQADTLIEATYLAVVDLLERIDRYSQTDEE